MLAMPTYILYNNLIQLDESLIDKKKSKQARAVNTSERERLSSLVVVDVDADAAAQSTRARHPRADRPTAPASYTHTIESNAFQFIRCQRERVGHVLQRGATGRSLSHKLAQIALLSVRFSPDADAPNFCAGAF